jgi:hypothetical protein
VRDDERRTDPLPLVLSSASHRDFDPLQWSRSRYRTAGIDPKASRQGRRAKRPRDDAGGSADDLSKILRELRFLDGGDVRYLALATISLAEAVAA